MQALQDEETFRRSPLYDYRQTNGHRLASRAGLIYNYPEGDFCHGKFKTGTIVYTPEK